VFVMRAICPKTIARSIFTVEYEENGRTLTETIETPQNELQALARFKRKHKKAENVRIVNAVHSRRVL
jgi:hypothetical protein